MDSSTKALLSNRSYDVLKLVATVILPALGALYFALAAVWGLPYSEQVVGTIAALNVAAGALLKASTTSYENSATAMDGSLNVVQQGETKVFSLELNQDPEVLEKQKKVTFKVSHL